jgi:hypothetical protein
MKKSYLIVSLLLFQLISNAQIPKKNILFIGNSYTYVNDLPQMFANVSASTFDSIAFSSSSTGGYTFNNHTQDANSLLKISQGNWDFVILQEQSQLPSFPIEQVNVEVFPYARILDSLIVAQNLCAETVFYMTWGRKNGDASNCASWPPVCSYLGMDSLLRLRYTQMATDNHAILSPVGALWRYLRTHNPTIELYSSDESHPSNAGTYAAACSFYSAIFRKDPTLITFNSTLSIADASAIRNAAKAVVFDSLSTWFVGKYDPKSDFNYSVVGLNVNFINISEYADQYRWDFGDGDTSITTNPAHLFTSSGTKTITLIAKKCGLSDTTTKQITITPQQIEINQQTDFELYPNPTTGILNFKSDIIANFDEYIIVNQLGQTIKKDDCKKIKAKNSICLAQLQNGIYSIIFINNKDQSRVIKKIIKID